MLIPGENNVGVYANELRAFCNFNRAKYLIVCHAREHVHEL
jgi:hypothetical protein